MPISQFHAIILVTSAYNMKIVFKKVQIFSQGGRVQAKSRRRRSHWSIEFDDVMPLSEAARKWRSDGNKWYEMLTHTNSTFTSIDNESK